jgi:hypothetical protein
LPSSTKPTKSSLINVVVSRHCSLCKEQKGANCFYLVKGKLSSRCISCNREYKKLWSLRNKERVKSYENARYKSDESFRLYRLNTAKNSYAEDKDTKNYKHKKACREASRRSQKLKATPRWLTEEHLKLIENFYWLCADLKAVTGEVYHVDHIVPLRGKNVCGLHVPWNLQVLPGDLNVSKNNRYPI